MRPGHIDQMFAAKCLHHYPPVESQEALLNAGFQNQIWVAVGQQNVGHGAVVAVVGSPRLGTGIGHDEAAFLVRFSAMEILVIKTALFSGGCLHKQVHVAKNNRLQLSLFRRNVQPLIIFTSSIVTFFYKFHLLMSIYFPYAKRYPLYQHGSETSHQLIR